LEKEQAEKRSLKRIQQSHVPDEYEPARKKRKGLTSEQNSQPLSRNREYQIEFSRQFLVPKMCSFGTPLFSLLEERRKRGGCETISSFLTGNISAEELMVWLIQDIVLSTECEKAEKKHALAAIHILIITAPKRTHWGFLIGSSKGNSRNVDEKPVRKSPNLHHVGKSNPRLFTSQELMDEEEEGTPFSFNDSGPSKSNQFLYFLMEDLDLGKDEEVLNCKLDIFCALSSKCKISELKEFAPLLSNHSLLALSQKNAKLSIKSKILTLLFHIFKGMADQTL